MPHADIPSTIALSIERAPNGQTTVTQVPPIDIAAERTAIDNKYTALKTSHASAFDALRASVDDTQAELAARLSTIEAQLAQAKLAATTLPIRHDSPLEMVIAIIAHEANRLYAASLGDTSHRVWDLTDPSVQASTIAGVRSVLAGTIQTPEQSHAEWCGYKRVQGWTYGPVKSITAKTHPNLVPFEQLPASEQTKDRLFLAIATALQNR